jgi:hypothetical protein
MKNFLCILVFIFIITGCKKDNNNNNNDNNNNNNVGNLVLNMSYHSSGKKSFKEVASVKTKSDTLYTQFGDYITSISPTAFIGKFLDMRLQNWDEGDTIWNYGFNIIDNNTPIDSSNRLANFSSNATVNFNLDPNAIPPGANVAYNIFVFISVFLYQEFELPAQYSTVASLTYLDFGSNNILGNFDSFFIGGNRTGLLIKGSSDPLLAPVFDSTWTGFNGGFPPMPKNFVFGSSDSTYLYYSNIMHHLNIDNPLGQEGYIIRSNAFNTITLSTVSSGETKTVNGSMTFDTHNLIQIYAGADNIPYTTDDVFVYAPNYWERLSVSMTVE